MGFLNKCLYWFKNLFKSTHDSKLTVVIFQGDLFAKPFAKDKLILLEDAGPYAVGFKCPCGCGEDIELTVMEGVTPRWDIEIDSSKRPTLRPSVWKQSGCRSHFWVKNGRIVWCD